MQNDGAGKSFLRKAWKCSAQRSQGRSQMLVTHLLEERRVRALKTSPHATRTEPGLSDIPCPVDHGIIHETVERRRELETEGSSRLVSWLSYPRPSMSRHLPSGHQVVSVAVRAQRRNVGRQVSGDYEHLFF